jgi:hypothetical protein
MMNLAHHLGLLAAGSALPPWRAFLVPIPLGGLWPLTVVPLVAGIAVVYKALKLDDLRRLPWQATQLTGKILAILALAAVGLWLLTEMM